LPVIDDTRYTFTLHLYMYHLYKLMIKILIRAYQNCFSFSFILKNKKVMTICMREF